VGRSSPFPSYLRREKEGTFISHGQYHSTICYNERGKEVESTSYGLVLLFCGFEKGKGKEGDELVSGHVPRCLPKGGGWEKDDWHSRGFFTITGKRKKRGRGGKRECQLNKFFKGRSGEGRRRKVRQSHDKLSYAEEGGGERKRNRCFTDDLKGGEGRRKTPRNPPVPSTTILV